MKKLSLRLSLMCLVFLMASPMAFADLYWESTTETMGMPAMPKGMPKQMLDQMKKQYKNKPSFTKTWLTTSSLRSENSDGIMIMDFDKMTMYQIKPADKTYTKVNMIDAYDMMESMGESKMKSTGETKKIEGYNCKKYIETTPMGEIEHWVTKDIKEYKELNAMSKAMASTFEKNPKLKRFHMAGSVDRLDGWPIRTVAEMMGIKTVSTVNKIEKLSCKKELFMVPKGYELKASRMPNFKKKKK